MHADGDRQGSVAELERPTVRMFAIGSRPLSRRNSFRTNGIPKIEPDWVSLTSVAADAALESHFLETAQLGRLP